MDSMRSLQTKNGMVINLDERHYYVSRSLEEKNEGPYCFRSIKEAAEAIPDGNRETWLMPIRQIIVQVRLHKQ